MDSASSQLLERVRRHERDRIGRLAVSLGILGAASLASIPAACLIGPMDIPAWKVADVVASLLPWREAEADPVLRTVVLELRLARVLLAFVVGASLAAAGTVFQGVLRNPLADPFTLGVSSGAAFGASLAIAMGLAGHALLSLGGLSLGVIPLAALLGAGGALTCVLLLARAAGGLRRETVVLAGIVVATFLAALVSLLKSLDEEAVASIVFWIMGSFQGRGLPELALAAPYAALGLAVIWLMARDLDALSLGAKQAEWLGVNARASRLGLLCAASLLAAASTAVAGVIGFVGLVAPHLCRLYAGSEHRPLLLLSSLTGGLGLLWADVAARSILPSGEELPVGVITALAGGPFFCLLLLKRAREAA
ncbi:FecCD family ABC transporter permease [Desulfohalovibrio reitneri]|uniref:FecCD family ABC transporter permease n=1 Tax=Desulfohalovibrio reitneri TaxID=1307759 RepID=UPI000A83BF11|nr:iron ABC transporter permease [Desulfohalovibrio reitneri]